MNQLSSEAHVFEPSSDDEPVELPCIRVLLVEDDERCREAMAAALEERGARVTAVGSVREAMASFEDEAPNIVISDIEMPGESGFDLIQRVRVLDGRRCRRTPAIAVTGLSIRDAARSAGFDDHLVKPVDLAVLVGRMRALVGSDYDSEP